MVNQVDELNKFHNSEWDFFENDIADFDKHLSDITAQLGPEFVNYLKMFLQKNQFIFTEGSKFSIELVVDTNIIFNEICAIMKGKPSFLKSIITNPFLSLFAPPEILGEVEKTIKEDLPKNSDKDKAREIAQEILSKVNILKGQQLQAWLKAYVLIGKRDRKDVPFLALAFSIESHGVISKDADFTEQEEVKIWQLGETGRMVSNLTKNSYAFFFLNCGVMPVLQSCYSLCILFLKLLAEVIKGLICVIAALLEGGIEALSKIPPWILITGIGVIVVTLLLWKEAREKVGDVFTKMSEIAREIGKKIKEVYSEIIDKIKQIIEILMPFIVFALKGIGYLFYSSGRLILQMQELENSRARLPTTT